MVAVNVVVSAAVVATSAVLKKTVLSKTWHLRHKQRRKPLRLRISSITQLLPIALKATRQAQKKAMISAHHAAAATAMAANAANAVMLITAKAARRKLLATTFSPASHRPTPKPMPPSLRLSL